MKSFASNENMIRYFTPEAAALFYFMRYHFLNGIIYPNKERAAKKLAVNRSTLSRWTKILVEKGLAVKRDTKHVVLLQTKAAIRKANGGVLPKHRCTIVVHDCYSRMDVEREVRIKLLEELHRQVKYKSRETKITQKVQEKYGPIHNEGIRESVKSRIKLDEDGFEEISGKAISTRMGISKRKWEGIQRMLRESGRISTRQQRDIVHQDGCPLVLSAAHYAMAKDDFGFTSFRRSNGEVVMVKPNLVRLMTWNPANALRKEERK